MPYRISGTANVVRPRRLGVPTVRPRRLGATPRINLGAVPPVDGTLGYLRRNDGGIAKKTKVF